ncbi:MAG: ribonuclease HII [Nitrospirae bacterium]|nr:ribonuclease HII [Nitrospirota bacterium]MBI5695131.1 ribonuclease HII [Nitrospirota bacterium]
MSGKRQGSFSFENGEGSSPSLYFFETDLHAQGYCLIAGVDEAGRGPLAGPVVAACVVLSPGQEIPGLNDSKKLTEAARDRLVVRICAEAADFGVGVVEADEIDSINILEATKKAMAQAIAELKTPPDYLLLDAVTLPLDIPQKPLIKGDARSASIAAASILAKTTRDRIMVGHHAKFPVYGFDRHKGYGCQSHMDAIKEHGACAIHRKSFRGVK